MREFNPDIQTYLKKRGGSVVGVGELGWSGDDAGGNFRLGSLLLYPCEVIVGGAVPQSNAKQH